MTRLRRLLVVLLGPLWVRTFRDPVREGHLRLDRLSRAEGQLARFGLVLLGLLLVSLLFSDLWRTGVLLQLIAACAILSGEGQSDTLQKSEQPSMPRFTE